MIGLLNQLNAFYGRPLTSLITVPFTELKNQIKTNMALMGINTEVHTYNGTLNLPHQFKDIVICDEAHHIMSPTWRNIPYIVDSEILCGFTGTPYRSDAEKLLEENGGMFDDLIMGPDMEELTKQGYLANLEYYSFPIKKVTKKYPFYCMGEYIGANEQHYYISDNRESKITEEYLKNFKDMPAIVFAKNVNHAADIAQRFNNIGILAKDINCYQPSKLKEGIINDVKNNHIQILVGIKMMSEGIDAPHLKLAIMARPIIGSLTMFLQQIGRVLRPYENETAKVLDLVGNIDNFGLPQQAMQRRIE
jgi:superfamily II DNA or RNA helicase